MRRRRVVVIGAGVGGLTTALLLAAKGEEVLLLERAAAPGGKMREIVVDGRPIDSGPTVFTMRWVFEQVFATAGAAFADHVRLEPATILARHAWNRETRLDLHAELARSADAIGRFAGAAEAQRFLGFAAEAKHIYRALEGPFLRDQRPNPVSLVMRAGLKGLGGLMRIKPFETMWNALGRHFTDPRLRQLFCRYATYSGSSPFDAPATLMLVAHVEQDGVWMVEGGMHRLAVAMADLAKERGATLRYGTEVAEILLDGARIRGVRTAAGEVIEASEVVVNADASAIGTGLFGQAVARAVSPVPAPARSLSAVTWSMLARTRGFPLTRHNVFFSGDYQKEFGEIAANVPSEPTVYICAQDRDGEVEGAERIFCLVNARAAGDLGIRPDVPAVEAAMRAKLRQCGLELEGDPEQSVVTTPADFAGMFPASGGALYGRASSGWRATFQRPGATTRIGGLYLAGGSVHPGPGVPMAALSGRLAVESLIEGRAST